MKVFVLEETFIGYARELDYTRVDSVYSTMRGAKSKIQELVDELIVENDGEVSESSDNYVIVDLPYGIVEFAINEQEVLA